MFKKHAYIFFCFTSFLFFTESVFAQDSLPLKINQPLVVEKIIITGNKQTKIHIITRELIFHEGDTLPWEVLNNAMERSRENLLNTSLFNFVTITHQEVEGNKVYIIIELIERWYIFPVPIFELVDRNFNEWWQDKNFKKANYGGYLSWENFRGRRENVRLLIRYGYAQRFEFSYNVPNIDKEQNNGLLFSGGETRYHEIVYKLENNKLVYFKNPDDFIRKEYKASIKYSHRSGFNKTVSVIGEYHYNEIADTVLHYNADYFVTGQTTERFPTLVLQYRNDSRDLRNYPLKGYFLNLDFVKEGFGLSGDDPSGTYAVLQYKKFWEINDAWHAAVSGKFKLSGQNDVPFYNQQALGYGGDLLRGYEYYVINGENFALLKTNIKLTLVRPGTIQVPINITKRFTKVPYALYLNAFGDAGYVRDRRFSKNNPLSNSWQYSYGAGLDYVTYYDIVLRVDFAINKFGESGFFIHLTAPI